MPCVAATGSWEAQLAPLTAGDSSTSSARLRAARAGAARCRTCPSSPSWQRWRAAPRSLRFLLVAGCCQGCTHRPTRRLGCCQGCTHRPTRRLGCCRGCTHRPTRRLGCCQGCTHRPTCRLGCCRGCTHPPTCRLGWRWGRGAFWGQPFQKGSGSGSSPVLQMAWERWRGKEAAARECAPFFHQGLVDIW